MTVSSKVVFDNKSNTYDKYEDPVYRATLPAAYRKHIARVIHRLDLYILVYVHLAKSQVHNSWTDGKEINAALRKYIEYTDKVLDKIWDESAKAEKDLTLTPEWHSQTLDEWLTVEFFVQRHNPEAFEEYAKDIQRLADLQNNPFELGMLGYHCTYEVNV